MIYHLLASAALAAEDIFFPCSAGKCSATSFLCLPNTALCCFLPMFWLPFLSSLVTPSACSVLSVSPPPYRGKHCSNHITRQQWLPSPCFSARTPSWKACQDTFRHLQTLRTLKLTVLKTIPMSQLTLLPLSPECWDCWCVTMPG